MPKIFKSNNKPKKHHDSTVHPSDQTSISKNSTKLGKLKSLIIKHKLIAIGLSTLTTAMITTAIALPVVYTIDPCSFNRCTQNKTANNTSNITNQTQATTQAKIETTSTEPTTATALRLLINSRRGFYLISGSNDSTIKYWDLSFVDHLATLTGHTAGITCLLRFSFNLLVSGSYDNTIRVWNLYFGNHLVTFDSKNSGHSGPITSLVTVSYILMASASYDSAVKIWDMESFALKFTLVGHRAKVGCLVMLNGLLASGSDDFSVKLWDPFKGYLNFTFDATNGGHSHAITALLSIHDDLLVSNANENELKVWEISSQTLKFTINSVINNRTGYFTALTLLDTGLVASGLSYGGIKVWSPENGSVVLTLNGSNSIYNGIDILFPIDNGLLAAVTNLTKIKLFDTINGSLLFTLEGHTDRVSCLGLIGYLVSGSWDHTIVVWNIFSGEIISSFNSTVGGHTGSVNALIHI